MIELLSMLGGGLLRLLPELFKFLNSKQDADHEYRMTQLQLEIDKARAEQQIDLAHAQAEIAADQAQMQAMVEALKEQAAPSGVSWIDGLSKSVRPVLTYWWCLALYTGYKAVTIYVAFNEHATLLQMAGMLVTSFDRDVIGSIISFWFVDRAIRNQSRPLE